MAYEINFCETKEQLKHLGEVVTGKTDGSPTGSDIATSTLPYTGQTRYTLSEIQRLFIESLRLGAESRRGAYVVGVTYDQPNWTYFYNGEYWGLSDSFDVTNLPYVATQADPSSDDNLMPRINASQSYVQALAIKTQGITINGSPYYGSGVSGVQNGDTIPVGTTHLVISDVLYDIVGANPSGLVANINTATAPYTVDIGGTEYILGVNSYGRNDIRYWGAVEGQDNRSSIIAMQDKVGFVDVASIDLLVSTPIATSEFTSGRLILKGDKNKYIRTVLGTTDFLDFDADLATFVSENVNYTAMDSIAETSNSDIEVGKVRFEGNYCHDIGQGLILSFYRNKGSKIINNDFENLTRSNRCNCVQLGFSSSDVDQGLRGDYIVTNNRARNIISTVDAEAHFIIAFGYRANVTNNTIRNVKNEGVKNAEGIYLQAPNSVVSNNILVDAGYSTNGSIAIKGDTRGEVGSNDGFNVTVSDNTIKFYTFDGTGMGIAILNESVNCIGNTIEGDSGSAILITAAERGRAVNVANNVISRSRSRFVIYNFSDTRELSITNNIISNCLYSGASLFAGIYIKALTQNVVNQLKVTGNEVTVASAITASELYGIVIDTGSSTTFYQSILSDNLINTINTTATTSKGLLITGSSVIDGITITGNRVFASDGELNIASGVTLTGDVIIDKTNKLSGKVYDLASSLTINEVAQPLIQRNAVAISRTLPPARNGLNYKMMKANPDANLVGFNTQGSDVFRGSFTVAQINYVGSIEVTCFEDGIWDITEGQPQFA